MGVVKEKGNGYTVHYEAVVCRHGCMEKIWSQRAPGSAMVSMQRVAAQQSARFCATCGAAATPQALFCVECGARLLNAAQAARGVRPPGVCLGGRYRLRRLIDMGGNGAVYEVRHEMLGTTHALKETLATDPESVGQFLAEARLLATLAHPVLVRVTDYFTEPSGAAFLVMDYVPGETLQHKLEQPAAPYTVSEVLGWLLQLCSALEYLHDYRDPATGQRRPIIHRDIKPLNVVLTPGGQIRLLDLGIARMVAPGEATGRVARAVTEPFAPIEQYGAGTDARSDLYALGITAYTLLTRQLPPSAPERIAQPQDLRVRAVNREVPPGVASAIERAMMPRPEARFPSVEAFRRALEAGWIAGGHEQPALSGRAPTGPDTSGFWATLRRALRGTAGPSSGAGSAAPASDFTLAEQLVEWHSRPEHNATLNVMLALERDAQGPARLRLTAAITERGPRGGQSLQQITLEGRDVRAFAARLVELLQLGSRLAAELSFTADRTTMHGVWRGGSGPLDLTIRTSGPRGGMKSCTIALSRRQLEGLVNELQRGLRRV